MSADRLENFSQVDSINASGQLISPTPSLFLCLREIFFLSTGFVARHVAHFIIVTTLTQGGEENTFAKNFAEFDLLEINIHDKMVGYFQAITCEFTTNSQIANMAS